MHEYKTDVDVDKLIRSHPAVILQYGSESCAPCHAIRNKIDAWLADHPKLPALYISVDDYPELAAQTGVLSAPTVVVYVDGRETLREAGYFSLDALLARLERYLEMLG